jgi:hypothetical protein
MRNKRGWLRILEATVAIMMVSGVLLVMYSKQVQREDISEYVYTTQQEVLSEISLRGDLRGMALRGNESGLNEFAGTKIPGAFNYYLRICNLSDGAGGILPCSLPDNVSIQLFRESRDVFAEETIISSDFSEGYDPKRVKLFIWEIEGTDIEIELEQGEEEQEEEPPIEFVMPTGLVSYWSFEDSEGLELSPSESLGQGLVGLWHLNEQVSGVGFEDDSGGSNIGGCSVPANECPLKMGGKFGYSTDFDGINDYISFPSPDSSTNLQTGTVSAWIKTDDAGTGYRGVIVKGSAYGIFLTNNELGIYDWGSSSWKGTGFYPNNGKWHHVAFSFQSGVADGVEIYLDGNSVGTTSMNVLDHTLDLAIGYGGALAASQWFNGEIDEVALWGRVLTSSDIQELYERGISKDSEGANDGEIIGALSIIGRNEIGNALDFEGSSNYLDLESSEDLDLETITISSWIYLNGDGDTSSGLNAIISKQKNANGYRLAYRNETELFEFSVWSSETNSVAYTDTVSQNQWYHVVGTFDGTYSKIFINGTEMTSGEPLNGGINYDPTNLLFGKYLTSNHYFNGTLDEVMIFNRALDILEIQAIYAEQSS